MIYSAILKYGYINFKLEILEYCDSKVLISREQGGKMDQTSLVHFAAVYRFASSRV